MAGVVECASTIIEFLKPVLSWIGRVVAKEYNYFGNREKNLKLLEAEMAELENQKRSIVGQSEKRVVSKLQNISDWLEKADKLKEEPAAEWKIESLTRKNCCSPPCYGWSQYKDGKEIAKRVVEVQEVNKEAIDLFTAQEDFVVGYMQETTELVGKTASFVKDIEKYVMGKDVGTIGVYGMAGSGKTAVVSKVNNLVLENYKYCAWENREDGTENVRGRFDKVIWVNVDHGLTDVLQKDIIQHLPPNDSSGDLARTLKNALQNKRFLIILDGIWKEFSLEEIGIPKPNKANGSKVIVISRSVPVCVDYDISYKLEIELLSFEEAKTLLEKTACLNLSGISKGTRDNVEEKIKECNGLPSVILLLAKTLIDLKTGDSVDGNVDINTAWEEALSRLSPDDLQSMQESAYAPLKQSYNTLRKESQPCLLYCALYPCGYDIEKRQLMEYWFWEGLLDCKLQQVEDMQAHDILEELTGVYLLEKVDEECIRMPSLVWHMANQITKTSPRFLIGAGDKKTKFPMQEQWPKFERASFMKGQLRTLGGEPKFYKLSTLLLQENPLDLDLDDDFFRSMPNLKVLDLSDTKISSLPEPSFSELKELTALLLRNCRKLQSIPSLANSTKLLVLDLSKTSITELPDGMKELRKLTRLNLSSTNVQIFPAELVPEFRLLEELFLITNDFCFEWGSAEGASIEQLGHFPELAVLHVRFPNAEAFHKYATEVTPKHCPRKFKFCVGGTCDEGIPENSIVFKGDFVVDGKQVALPQRISELHVTSNGDLHWLHFTCPLKKLKVINISGCKSLVYLFKVDMLDNLPELEKISVEKCPKMVGLIYSEESSTDLRTPQKNPVKIIHVSYCENLVYLFWRKMLPYFKNLQEISIIRRERMEVEKRQPNYELVLVDPLKLSKIYNGVLTKADSQQSIWYFDGLNMQIITSLRDEEPLASARGADLIRRHNSFAINARQYRSFSATTLRRGTIRAPIATDESEGKTSDSRSQDKQELAFDNYQEEVAEKMLVLKDRMNLGGLDEDTTQTPAMDESLSLPRRLDISAASDPIDQEKPDLAMANKIIVPKDGSHKTVVLGTGMGNMVQSLQSLSTIAQSWAPEFVSLMSQLDEAKTRAEKAEERVLTAKVFREDAESMASDMLTVLYDFHAQYSRYKTHQDVYK